MKHLVFFGFSLFVVIQTCSCYAQYPVPAFICYLSRMQRIFFSLFAFFAKKLPLSPIANRAFLRCLSVVYSTQKKSIGSPFFWEKKRALHEKIKKRRVLKKTQIYPPKAFKFPRSE